MSTRGLARIRESEAFIPKVYDDGVGKTTFRLFFVRSRLIRDIHDDVAVFLASGGNGP
jgi:hypothetical protein